MASDQCTCGEKFLDAEDFRDHLPCPGDKAARAWSEGYDKGYEAGVQAMTRKMRDVAETLILEQQIDNG